MWEPLPSKPAECITCSSAPAVSLDPVVDDLLGDPGAAEGVHSKRVDRLTAKAGGAVAWGEELKIELHC